MDRMLTITLWQPWATLCVIGKKPFETRGRPPIIGAIGTRIAVHAAAQIVNDSHITPRARQTMNRIFGGTDWFDTLPRSAVVGTVLLRGAYHIAEYDAATDTARTDRAVGDVPWDGPDHQVTTDNLGWYSAGRWAWLIEQAETFDPPYSQRGYQGFWWWDRPSAKAA
jgi:hypothetical protein